MAEVNYSIQPSTQKPEGVSGDWIRLQLHLKTQTDKVVLSNDEHDKLISAMQDGRLIGLESTDGRLIGQFQPGISGGHLQSDFISPNVGDFRVGFKPAAKLLETIRLSLLFNQVPTVLLNPTVLSVRFINSRGELVDSIRLEDGGMLKLTGTNFIKDGIAIKISQVKSDNSVVEKEFSLLANSGTKVADFIINHEALLSEDYENNEAGAEPVSTKIKLWQVGVPLKNVDYSIQVVAAFVYPTDALILDGGSVRCSAVMNGRVYFGTTDSFKVFNSAEGVVWDDFVVDAASSVRAMIYFGGEYFAVTYSGATYVSSDTITWVSVDTGKPQPFAIISFNNKCYLATDDGKIFQSDMTHPLDVLTWTEVLSSSADSMRAFTIFNDMLYVSGGSPDKIYRTNDGTTWTQQLNATDAHSFNSLVVYNGFIYAGAEPTGDVWRSADGVSWNKTALSLDSDVATLNTYNGFLFAGTQASGLLYKTSNGEDWIEEINIDNGDRVICTSVFDDMLFLGMRDVGKVVMVK